MDDMKYVLGKGKERSSMGKWIGRTVTAGAILAGLGTAGAYINGCPEEDYKGREIQFNGSNKPWVMAAEIADRACDTADFFEKFDKCSPHYWLAEIKEMNPGMNYGTMKVGDRYFIPDLD